MIPVSNLDAAMLYAETPEMPMHTMGVLILERRELPEDPNQRDSSSFELTRRVFSERIHLIPPFRRRVVQGPLQIGDPHWIEDPDFDLDQHLVHATLPSPGSMRQLCELVGRFASTCLSRDRPLWKAIFVEGLEGDRLALLMKIHHAAMDGGRAAAIAGELLDTSPEGRAAPTPEDPWIPDREPSVPWLAADTIRTLLGKPRRALEATARIRAAARARSDSEPPSPRNGGREEKQPFFEAPSTPFNGALSTDRSVALVDVPFEDVKAIKRSFETTVNDVVLAACTAGLRSWLQSHGGLPERPLVATVPVSVRHDGDQAANRVSIIRVHLPIHEEDPVARLLGIHDETSRRKKAHRGGGGGDVLKDVTDLITNVTIPWMMTHAMSLFSSQHLADHLPPLWNLVISNIAGPAVPLYTTSAKLTHLFPLGPVQQGSGLNITVMSAVDRLCFGALACSELVPDLEEIGSGFVDEVTLLRALVR